MKIVKRLINEGVNKNDIFERAVEDELDLKKVSKILAMCPDSEEAEKYKTANYILMTIYLVMVLLSILPLLWNQALETVLIVLAVALIIPGAILQSIYKKQYFGYIIFCFFMMKGTFESFEGYELNSIVTWVAIVLDVFLFAYAIILKNKLFPYQNFFNTKKNSEGITIFTKSIVTNQGSSISES